MFLRCENICDIGYYGAGCNKQCPCKGEPCDHITGVCQSLLEQNVSKLQNTIRKNIIFIKMY